MLKLRVAKVQVCGIYVDCPKCGESIVEPNGTGSFLWNTIEVASGGVFVCECGTEVKLPKRVDLF